MYCNFRWCHHPFNPPFIYVFFSLLDPLGYEPLDFHSLFGRFPWFSLTGRSILLFVQRSVPVRNGPDVGRLLTRTSSEVNTGG